MMAGVGTKLVLLAVGLIVLSLRAVREILITTFEGGKSLCTPCLCL